MCRETAAALRPSNGNNGERDPAAGVNRFRSVQTTKLKRNFSTEADAIFPWPHVSCATLSTSAAMSALRHQEAVLQQQKDTAAQSFSSPIIFFLFLSSTYTDTKSCSYITNEAIKHDSEMRDRSTHPLIEV